MNEQAVILRDGEKLSLSKSILDLKAQALENCALLNRCESPADQVELVNAQKYLKGVLSAVEKGRKDAKQPILDAGRMLDELVAKEVAELNDEGNRVARLVNDYQERERIKAAAAQALLQKQIDEEERKKNELLKNATTIAEADQIRDESSQRVAVAQQKQAAAAPPQVRGQSVRDEWEITIVNPFKLAQFHPQCVEVTPRLSEIKILLNQGISVNGVTAKKVVKSSVRASRPIDV